MTQRHVIDCRALRDTVISVPGGLEAVQAWLRANGITPSDVPLDSDIVIEDSAYGIVIRYTSFRRNEQGNLYVDPENPEYAASRVRTAVLLVAPAPQWLDAAGGER
ncbi:hypothetical protein ACIQPQ_34595 [Streptomyces sp. NPDC091281]|uniref:hypothetical protein n=1 Tax=Streptomyces sp. NPDC091281 TaxID=3365985 RepID=UPI00380480F7